MGLKFRQDFLDAATNCNYCSEENMNQSNTDLTSQAASNKYLNKIIKSSEEGSQERDVASLLLGVCSSCGFKPKRKNHLEIYGINI